MIKSPTKRELKYFLKNAVVTGVFMLLIYMPLNVLSLFSREIYRFYFDWEKEIPIIPWMIIPYFSLYFSFVLIPFILDRKTMFKLCRCFNWSILISGVVYLFFPSELYYPRHAPDSIFKPLFVLIYTLDSPYNLLPSLHVSFTLSLSMYFNQFTDRLYQKIILIIWFVLVSASIVFVHQHHVLDIFAGILLSLSCYLLVEKNRTLEIHS